MMRRGTDYGKEKQELLSGKNESRPSFFLSEIVIKKRMNANRRGRWFLGLTDKEIEERVTGLVKVGI